jgi:hypothetical protein
MEWVVRSAETGAHAVETLYLIHIDDMTNTAVKVPILSHPKYCVGLTNT